jgi:hypothetical protein
MNLPDYLGSLGACPEAREWAAGYSTLAEAWTACERADWLLWYAGRHDDVDRRLLVRAACACARTALPHVPPGEDRPRLAIELAEAWCNGRATIVEVRTAANAAAAAAESPAAAAEAVGGFSCSISRPSASRAASTSAISLRFIADNALRRRDCAASARAPQL